MEPLLIANWILFLAVTAYALALFTYLIKTRIQFIKLGRKEEFDNNVKERLRKIWVYVFGQKKLLKDKKEWNHPRHVLLRIFTRPIWGN